MKVLVACEESQEVTKAFINAGHDAMSCDLLPGAKGLPHHMGDVREILYNDWDLIIAHPPCTYLSNSGVRWLYKRGTRERIGERWTAMFEASRFFKLFLDHPCKKVCVENPVPHGYASLPASTQRVQPYQFGHGETKMTCLWLKGLPKLQYTSVVFGREARVHRMAPGPDRAKMRSKTYPGIAKAMAEQWGNTNLIQ